MKRLALGICILGILASQASYGSLELRMSANKTEYLVGEPFWVSLALCNTGPQAVKVFTGLKPEIDAVMTFEVKPPGEKMRRYRQLGSADLASYDPYYPLSPGEDYSASIDLTHETGQQDPRKLEPTLARPGVYVFAATYHVADLEPLRSNEIRVVVSEPQGIDRKAFEFLYRNPLADKWGMWSPVCSEYHRQLVADFPRSRYAPYAEYYIASRLSHPPSPGEPGSKSAQLEAARLFYSAARKLDGTPLGLFSMRRAGKAYWKAGRVDLARRLLQESYAHSQATDTDRSDSLSLLKQFTSP